MFYSKPWLDALIVLFVVLMFFGPKRLPTLGRSLGQGFREFKDGITGAHKDDEDEQPPALNAAQPTQMAAQAPPAAAQAPPAGAPPAGAPPSPPPAAQPPATPAPPAGVAAQPQGSPEQEQRS
jgi:sec-independent protein translocase protein TatA